MPKKFDDTKPIGMCSINEVVDHLSQREVLRFALVMLYTTEEGEMDYVWSGRAALSDEKLLAEGFKKMMEELRKKGGKDA